MRSTPLRTLDQKYIKKGWVVSSTRLWEPEHLRLYHIVQLPPVFSNLIRHHYRLLCPLLLQDGIVVQAAQRGTRRVVLPDNSDSSGISNVTAFAHINPPSVDGVIKVGARNRVALTGSENTKPGHRASRGELGCPFFAALHMCAINQIGSRIG